ncbi:Dynamin-related protein 3A [Forsythia ovata]|uniref:Dynamin-related protein 3A n=1 Tax=Forsythia ovata TaxID=205694 RepID=A0ABD1W8N3_9LAMI
MINSYIKPQSCLILAVAPANSDLANSDALQLAKTADRGGPRTIGVITKLDIMNRGTHASKILLGKDVHLQIGYVGVVNHSQEDILMNRSIKDALIAKEKFFHSHPTYKDLADRCGVPQLAKKLNQILIQHIKTVLPYSQAFSSMIEGKNEEMSTSELSGGARIHYIFQNIFVKSLEEVDPCEGLTDDDIYTAIQNATGLKSALFVPDVPFEVLVRRQIARLLDPSLQCARFIYDELVKMSHHCMSNELQRFPVLRKRMNEVMGDILREGLEPSETMIGHIIEMEMDYINTSHPNFIGGRKAVEVAQQMRTSRAAAPIARQKDAGESEKSLNSEKSIKSRTILVRPVADVENSVPSGSSASATWGISSFFGGSNNRTSVKEIQISRHLANLFRVWSIMFH